MSVTRSTLRVSPPESRVNSRFVNYLWIIPNADTDGRRVVENYGFLMKLYKDLGTATAIFPKILHSLYFNTKKLKMVKVVLFWRKIKVLIEEYPPMSRSQHSQHQRLGYLDLGSISSSSLTTSTPAPACSQVLCVIHMEWSKYPKCLGLLQQWTITNQFISTDEGSRLLAPVIPGTMNLIIVRKH